MGIIKHGNPDTKFTQIPNEALRDKNISWTAIGLLSHLLSHNDGFNVTIESLSRASKSGSSQTRSALNELREAGYVHFGGREVEKGKYTNSIWIVYKYPVGSDESLSEIPTDEFPSVENRTEEITHVYKEEQYKNTNKRTPKEDICENEFSPEEELFPQAVDNNTLVVKSERPRDVIWDALCEVCGIISSEIPKSARGKINKAVSELKSVGATDVGIYERAKVYKWFYPDIKITPMGLVTHWAECNPNNAKEIITKHQRDKELQQLETRTTLDETLSKIAQKKELEGQI